MLLTAMQDKPNQAYRHTGERSLVACWVTGVLSLLAEIAWGGQALLFPPVDVAFTISHLTSADAASPYK